MIRGKAKGQIFIIIRLQAHIVLIIKLALPNASPPIWLLRLLFGWRRNKKNFAKAIITWKCLYHRPLQGVEQKEPSVTQDNDNEDNENIRGGEGAHTAEHWARTPPVCSRDKTSRGSSLQSGRQHTAASGKSEKSHSRRKKGILKAFQGVEGVFLSYSFSRVKSGEDSGCSYKHSALLSLPEI